LACNIIPHARGRVVSIFTNSYNHVKAAFRDTVYKLALIRWLFY
jgi:hypothetical protein